ncbi:MAG: amidohydrolase, partial [Alistipes sp.]|nr:amidohydrolase [Alistipes sp.]
MNYKEIQQQAAALFAQTATDRRNIHSHPELSFQEHQTSQYIAERLEAEGIAYRPIAGTGILAKIEGGGDLRRCVVLRADMDALPIEEENALSYRSCNEGVMHACGHDMHTACLLGALTLLHRHRNEIQGTLFGLFQPGEEVAPGGASKVMAEDPFRDYHVVAFVGEHVGPELPAGCFGFRAGQYMASSDELH